MSLPGLLCRFGLKHLFGVSADAVGEWVDRRFEDASRDLVRAILDANRRAWHVLALTLTEQALCARLGDLLREADLRAVRGELRPALAALPDEVRALAGEELSGLHDRQRAAGMADLEDGAEAVRRFSDPAGLAAAADRAAADLPAALGDGAANLVAVLRLTPDGRTPLFQTLYRHQFRKLAARNAALSALLLHDQLRALSEMADARTAGALDQLDVLFDRVEAGFAAVAARLRTVDAKLDQLLDRHGVATGARDPLRVTVTNEQELAALRQWRDEVRGLPPAAVGAALQAKLGDALAAARMFAEAREAHAAAARAAVDRTARAEAEFKAYRDACEQEAWADALPALRRAADLDPDRFTPFPLKRYEPVEIVGVGGFGAVVRCRDRLARNREVAVKAFHAADLGRPPDEVFAEAHALSELTDPAIVRIVGWEYADAADSRPYLVMEYFPGESLAARVRRGGPLPAADLIAVARRVAEAMAVAHASGVLHRDLKPGNVLVRQADDGRWEVRVIDFGLAVRFAAAQASVSTAAAHRTRRDLSFAGSLEYASPEQKGQSAVPVGPRSDVYSFGRTMIEALLGTPSPDSDDWAAVPDEFRAALQSLLEKCVKREPARRPSGFAEVAEALARLDRSEQTADARRQAALEFLRAFERDPPSEFELADAWAAVEAAGAPHPALNDTHRRRGAAAARWAPHLRKLRRGAAHLAYENDLLMVEAWGNGVALAGCRAADEYAPRVREAAARVTLVADLEKRVKAAETGGSEAAVTAAAAKLPSRYLHPFATRTRSLAAEARKCPQCFAEKLVVEMAGVSSFGDDDPPRSTRNPKDAKETGYLECRNCSFRFHRSLQKTRKLSFPVIRARCGGGNVLLTTAYDKIRRGLAPTAATLQPIPSLGGQLYEEFIDEWMNQKRQLCGTAHDMPTPLMIQVRDADPQGASTAVMNLFNYAPEMLSCRIDEDKMKRQAVLMDGFVVLLDPTQLYGGGADTTLDRQVAALNEFMADARQERGIAPGQFIPVPVAVVIPKLDLLLTENPIAGESVPFIRQILGELNPPPKQTTLATIQERSAVVGRLLGVMFRGFDVRGLFEGYFGPQVMFFPASSVSLFENELGIKDLSRRTLAPFGVAEPFVWLLHMHGYKMFADRA